MIIIIILSTESSIVDPNSDWNTLGGIWNCPSITSSLSLTDMSFKLQNLIKIITELTANAGLKMVIEQEFS